MTRDILWKRSGTPSKRYFCWHYYLKREDFGTRPFSTQIHKVRDGLAMHLLGGVLSEHGYGFGGALLNVPAYQGWECRDGQLLDIVSSQSIACSPNDILLLATRPPLNDPHKPSKGSKIVDHSGFVTEALVLDTLRKTFFRFCDRSRIVLRDDLTCTPTQATIFRSVIFDVYRGGKVARFNGDGRTPWRSAIPPAGIRCGTGYLAVVPNVGEHQLRIIAVFSSGGTETLWWSWLLVHHYRHLLTEAVNQNSPKMWQGLFALPQTVPTVLSAEDALFEVLHRKSDAPWPKIIEWHKVKKRRRSG
jgi:hypothetical protein